MGQRTHGPMPRGKGKRGMDKEIGDGPRSKTVAMLWGGELADFVFDTETCRWTETNCSNSICTCVKVSCRELLQSNGLQEY